MDQATSSSTTDDIIRGARFRLNDLGTPYYHGGDALLSYLNNGLVYLARDSGAYQTTETIVLANNTLEYDLSLDYLMLETVLYTNATGGVKALEKGSPKEVGRYSAAVPSKYYEWESKVGIYPVLSSVSGEGVKVYATRRPSAISDGDQIPLPALMDLALIYFVVAQGLIKEKRWASCATMMGMCDAEAAKARVLLGV